MPATRELFPGYLVLDCDKLRASMAPAACLDNFMQRRTLSCIGCPTGRELSEQAGAPADKCQHHRNSRSIESCKWKTCLRCSRQANRLVAGAICVACYNRQRELEIGRNAKGQAPVRIRERLHPFLAEIIASPQTIDAARRRAGRTFSITALSAGSARVTGYALTASEVDRIIGAVAPGARVVECAFAA